MLREKKAYIPTIKAGLNPPWFYMILNSLPEKLAC